MNNPLIMEISQSHCDLIDNPARLIIMYTSRVTFNIRSQISACNKVLNDVTKEYYSATG